MIDVKGPLVSLVLVYGNVSGKHAACIHNILPMRSVRSFFIDSLSDIKILVSLSHTARQSWHQSLESTPVLFGHSRRSK